MMIFANPNVLAVFFNCVNFEYCNGTNDNDEMYGSFGDSKMYGLNGDDNVAGHGGNDLLYGGPGNDVIWGGTGLDTIYGEDGDDYLFAGANFIAGGYVVGGQFGDRLWVAQ